MYIVPDMIDLGLDEGQKWASAAHREVAQKILIGNPRVTGRDVLHHNVQIINAIPPDKIKTVTLADLVALGCGDYRMG